VPAKIDALRWPAAQCASCRINFTCGRQARGKEGKLDWKETVLGLRLRGQKVRPASLFLLDLIGSWSSV
jgi:hypothetical protein